MKSNELKEFLDTKVVQYNHPGFLESDPIGIPHRFTVREDIEISGFLTAAIAWGNRKGIIRNASAMMDLMDNSPYDFIRNHSEKDVERLGSFVHRTFNGSDFGVFVRGLQHIYLKYGGPEAVFASNASETSLQPAISAFKRAFFEEFPNNRTWKHLPDPEKGSAAKRMNMFLRWMVRKDNNGVDFGLWDTIPARLLSCPLDVHSGKVARKLGLLHRTQNDSKAVAELDRSLRTLNPEDPVIYDYALFGLGVFERF